MWPNPPETADSVTFTEEIVNGKLYFFVQYLKNGFWHTAKQTNKQKNKQ